MKLFTPQQLWVQSAILILAFVPTLLVAHGIDLRQLLLGIWVKPLKFHLSTVALGHICGGCMLPAKPDETLGVVIGYCAYFYNCYLV